MTEVEILVTGGCGFIGSTLVARLVQHGDDVTVLVYSSLTGRLLALNEELRRRGIAAEIVDLRTVDLHGIDYDTIGDSLARTGALAIVEEAAAGQGIGPRIAAEVSRRFFDDLDAPVACLASLDVPTSVSRVLEAAALISDEQILDQIMVAPSLHDPAGWE